MRVPLCRWLVSNGAVSGAVSGAFSGANPSLGVSSRTPPVLVHLETAGDQTDRTGPANPYVTGSITVDTSEVLFACTLESQTLTTAVPPASVGGTGFSLTKIAEVLNFDATSPARTASLWRGRPGANFTGTIAIDFGSEVMTGCAWSMVKVQQADLSGANGAGAVAQFKTATSANATVTTLTATFDNALEFAQNVCLGFVGLDTANAITPAAGFAELGEGGYANPGARIQAESRSGVGTMAPSWASSKAGLFIVEVKAG